MAGLSAIALSTAPILGGALLAGAAGQLRGPDYRSGINQDLDLLERLPADQVARRAAILRTVELRIDDLVSATYKSRQMRAAAVSYQGNWRDMSVSRVAWNLGDDPWRLYAAVPAGSVSGWACRLRAATSWGICL